MGYTQRANYTPEELDAAALRDLRVDADCAERDGLHGYAAECRATIERFRDGGAHKHILGGKP